MFALAMLDGKGEITYIEKMNKKNATTSKNKFDARTFYSPGEAELAFREKFGNKFRIFNKPTEKGIFIVEL